jgi:hypothetical protein
MHRSTIATLAAAGIAAAVLAPTAASAAPPVKSTDPSVSLRVHSFALDPGAAAEWNVPLAPGESIASLWFEESPGSQVVRADGVHGLANEMAPGTPPVVAVQNTDSTAPGSVVMHYLVMSGQEVVVP